MTRILPFLIPCPVVLLMTMSGCRPSDDESPLEPSDAELAETIERYCSLAVPCYPGVWDEPEHDTCVAQQEGWAARSAECREARYDYCQCIIDAIEVGSCAALEGPTCRMESNNSGALSCELSQ